MYNVLIEYFGYLDAQQDYLICNTMQMKFFSLFQPKFAVKTEYFCLFKKYFNHSHFDIEAS